MTTSHLFSVENHFSSVLHTKRGWNIYILSFARIVLLINVPPVDFMWLGDDGLGSF